VSHDYGESKTGTLKWRNKNIAQNISPVTCDMIKISNFI